MTDIISVYLDNNATTRVNEETAEYIKSFMVEDYAIASSQFSHSMGIKAREAVEKARVTISSKINAEPGEIVFTSGGTEANNLVLQGLARLNEESNRKKIIISGIEHFSVLHTAQMLEKKGFEIKYCRVDKHGLIDEEHLKSLVDGKTLLVSILHGNHEMGALQNISSLADIAHNKGAFFHTDASVSFGQVDIDAKESGLDFMTMSGHKIYGPKGVGALFIKKGMNLSKLLYGGFSENNMRGGTENVPGIAGFGKAVETLQESDISTAGFLRDYLFSRISSEIDNISLNGPEDFSRRIPNNLNISFEYIEGESIVLHLDLKGISVITGSACFSKSLQASHVLMAMGFSHQRAHSSIRFSTSRYLSKTEMDYTVERLRETVENLRRLSPLYK